MTTRVGVAGIKAGASRGDTLVIVGSRPHDEMAAESSGVSKRYLLGGVGAGKGRRRNQGKGAALGEKKQLLFLSLPRVDIADEVTTMDGSFIGIVTAMPIAVFVVVDIVVVSVDVIVNSRSFVVPVVISRAMISYSSTSLT